MRKPLWFPAVLAALTALAASCGDSGGPVQPPAGAKAIVARLETGTLFVHVFFGDDGVPGKRVEVLELGRVGITDENGWVEFTLPVGDFTVRVYDVNRGGPALRNIDTKVAIATDEATTIGVFDCLACV
jgi:hypothetical protein